MGLSDDIKKVEANLKRIAGYYDELNEKNPFSGANAKNIAASADEMQKLEDAVKGTATRVKEIDNSLENLVTRFKSANNEIKTGSEGLKSMNQILSQQASSVEKVRNYQQGISDLSTKQLQKELEKIKSAQSRLSISKQLLEEEKNDLTEKKRQGKISTRELSKLAKINAALKVNAQLSGKKNKDYKNAVGVLEDEIKGSKNLQKSLGLSGALAKGISKIPILGDLINAGEAFDEVQEKARQIQIETGKVPSKLKTAGMFAKQLGSNLLSAAMDPLVGFGLMIKAFKTLVSLGFAADTQITDLSKSMASSKGEAAGVRDRMVEIQDSSNSLLMTTQNQVGATLELADALGTISGLSEQQVADQVKITKQMGLSNEQAAGLQQLSLASGQSITDIEKAVIKQTSSLKKQTGVQLNNKKILGEVAKVEGQLRLMYGNNPKLIAKAVVQTQKLGLSLEQAKKMADGLLNFEQSITNELEAELLLGKDLNFETARQLALNGDVAGAAAEIAKQVGSAADFAKMNVIQQEALAKAAGMSADELANSLVYQENLNKLGDKSKQQLKEKVDALMAKGEVEEAQRLMAAAGDEEQALAALERMSAQEEFNAAMDKLKSIIGDMVSGPMAGFLDSLSRTLKDGDKMKSIFSTIKGVIKGLGWAAVAYAAMQVYGFGAMIPVVGPAIGAAAAIATAAYGASLMSKVNDAVIPGDTTSGYGKRMLTGPEGTIQLNNKDTVIAGTNLFGDDVKSEPGKATEMAGKGEIKVKGGGDMSSVISAINTLSGKLNAIASRPINVNIDGNKVITATTDQKPNEVGAAIGKNSFQVQ